MLKEVLIMIPNNGINLLEVVVEVFVHLCSNFRLVNDYGPIGRLVLQYHLLCGGSSRRLHRLLLDVDYFLLYPQGIYLFCYRTNHFFTVVGLHFTYFVICFLLYNGIIVVFRQKHSFLSSTKAR